MNTILIVDDEKNSLRLYENKFRLDGYSVVTANSGIEALQKLKTTPVNLLIRDIRMPELDGVETLENIMELPSRPLIIPNSACTRYKDCFLTWAAAAYLSSHLLSQLIPMLSSLFDFPM